MRDFQFSVCACHRPPAAYSRIACARTQNTVLVLVVERLEGLLPWRHATDGVRMLTSFRLCVGKS